MVQTSRSRIAKGSGERRTIYLRKDLVTDSTFPFETGQEVIVRIEAERLIIEALKEGN